MSKSDITPVNEDFLASVPINGFDKEGGSQYVLELPFKWLSQQLKNGGKLKHSDVMSQINVTEEGIIIFVKDKHQRPKEDS